VSMLFAEQDPISETIRVQGLACTVIGVLGVKGQTATGQDQDDRIRLAVDRRCGHHEHHAGLGDRAYS
jgi:hypothetical protein